MTEPFVSIVLTARHDNYGGDVRERIIKPLQFNAARLSEHGVSYEVILVEWDPIPGRPLLSELLDTHLPESIARTIRRIVVVAEYQRALTQNPRPFYLEYLAKNVGIRRATTPFILVSNIDILLGRVVVEMLAGKPAGPAKAGHYDLPFASGTIYRAPRYDIKLGVDHTGLSWGALEDSANHEHRSVLRPPLFSHGAADFLLADRETFHRLRGFNEVYRVARVGIDANFMAKAYGAGHRIEEIGGPVYHVNHVGSFRISKSIADDAPDSSWGSVNWHARHVTYNNPDGWGLADAPERQGPDGTTFLDFDWRAVPPLVDLRRITLPARQTAVETV